MSSLAPPLAARAGPPTPAAGPALPGPFYERDAAAVCVQVGGAQLYHELGDEILAQSFVGGTEMVE